MILDGFFLDCWPPYDRLARLMERQLQLTSWGPILDHGIGFNFDCFYHHLYTGDLEALEEPYPRLLRFAAYMSLAGIQPLAPGFRRCQIRPQLADLESLELVAQTVRGALTFKAAGRKGKRELHLVLPPGCEAELLVPQQETLELPSVPGQAPFELRRYRLQPGREINLLLHHV